MQPGLSRRHSAGLQRVKRGEKSKNKGLRIRLLPVKPSASVLISAHTDSHSAFPGPGLVAFVSTWRLEKRATVDDAAECGSKQMRAAWSLPTPAVNFLCRSY